MFFTFFVWLAVIEGWGWQIEHNVFQQCHYLKLSLKENKKWWRDISIHTLILFLIVPEIGGGFFKASTFARTTKKKKKSCFSHAEVYFSTHLFIHTTNTCHFWSFWFTHIKCMSSLDFLLLCDIYFWTLWFLDCIHFLVIINMHVTHSTSDVAYLKSWHIYK